MQPACWPCATAHREREREKEKQRGGRDFVCDVLNTNPNPGTNTDTKAIPLSLSPIVCQLNRPSRLWRDFVQSSAEWPTQLTCELGSSTAKRTKPPKLQKRNEYQAGSSPTMETQHLGEGKTHAKTPFFFAVNDMSRKAK